MLVAALSVSEIAQGRRSRRARGKCRKAHTFGSGMVGLLGRETGVPGPVGGKPRDGRTTEATSRREKSVASGATERSGC